MRLLRSLDLKQKSFVTVVKVIKFPFLSGIILLLITGITGCTEETAQLTKGQATPVFDLPKIQQGSLHFPKDVQNKVIAIRFWADWCPFCKTEMRDVEPVYQEYKDQGLVILAINVRQNQDTVQAFIKDLNISYDVLLDESGEIARAYGVSGLPITFFMGREGTLQTRILGESTPEIFESIIQELL
ncbi:MAG: TlpA family protein disulfide reductase [Thiothrix sp.]|nr:MAG: TlpA family protein disulfide reductase [Thiothrix sp.]